MRYEAHAASGELVGTLSVYEVGEHPHVLQDQFGSTWVFRSDKPRSFGYYERVARADAVLEVIK